MQPCSISQAAGDFGSLADTDFSDKGLARLENALRLEVGRKISEKHSVPGTQSTVTISESA